MTLTIMWLLGRHGLRWIAILLFSWTAGGAVAVMIEARRYRPPSIYTWLIASSYITLVAGWSLELHSRLGEPVGWRVWFALSAGAFGFAAMIAHYHHYRLTRRIVRHSAKSDEAAAKMLAQARGEHPDDEAEPARRLHHWQTILCLMTSAAVVTAVAIQLYRVDVRVNRACAEVKMLAGRLGTVPPHC